MTEKKKSLLVRNIISIVAIIIACFVIWNRLQARNLIQKENAAVEAYNNEKYAEALQIYSELREICKSEETKERAGVGMAECYVAQAEDPALSVKARLELYRKAYELSPASVDNPALLKRLKSAE